LLKFANLIEGKNTNFRMKEIKQEKDLTEMIHDTVSKRIRMKTILTLM